MTDFAVLVLGKKKTYQTIIFSTKIIALPLALDSAGGCDPPSLV
jgi:hypothetical protein